MSVVLILFAKLHQSVVIIQAHNIGFWRVIRKNDRLYYAKIRKDNTQPSKNDKMKSNKSTNVNMNASANINIQHLTKKNTLQLLKSITISWNRKKTFKHPSPSTYPTHATQTLQKRPEAFRTHVATGLQPWRANTLA